MKKFVCALFVVLMAMGCSKVVVPADVTAPIETTVKDPVTAVNTPVVSEAVITTDAVVVPVDAVDAVKAVKAVIVAGDSTAAVPAN